MNGETLIFSCAGAAHCGQAANSAALQLTKDHVGQVFCLAAVSADIPDKMQRSRAAARRVAIDGCDDHCARITLEQADLPVDLHVVATMLGVEQKPAEPRLTDDARLLANHVREALAFVKIEVFGTGCARCGSLESNARAAAEKLGLEYELAHVTELSEIVARGVMLTPALGINGKVVVVGKVASEAELTTLLTTALE